MSDHDLTCQAASSLNARILAPRWRRPAGRGPNTGCELPVVEGSTRSTCHHVRTWLAWERPGATPRAAAAAKWQGAARAHDQSEGGGGEPRHGCDILPGPRQARGARLHCRRATPFSPTAPIEPVMSVSSRAAPSGADPSASRPITGRSPGARVMRCRKSTRLGSLRCSPGSSVSTHVFRGFSSCALILWPSWPTQRRIQRRCADLGAVVASSPAWPKT